MKIARVFPSKTSMTPNDCNAYWGPPNLFTPGYDEIHISVSFTWDVPKAKKLKREWERIAPVKIAGPAINGEPTDSFISGKYLKQGVTITSRGCPNRCPWCHIQTPLIELGGFPEGNIIQDNNILACSKTHQERVFNMLSSQSGIQFLGGLDSRLITDWTVERLRGLKIKQLFFALDCADAEIPLKKAINKIKKYFPRNKLRCFVLIGYDGDTIQKAESRLVRAWEIGCLPFAMLYRNREGKYPQPQKEWKWFQRMWTRPAIYNAWLKDNLRGIWGDGLIQEIPEGGE